MQEEPTLPGLGAIAGQPAPRMSDMATRMYVGEDVETNRRPPVRWFA